MKADAGGVASATNGGSKSTHAAAVAVGMVFALVAFIYWPTVAHLLGIGAPSGSTTDAPLVVLVVLTLTWNLRHRLSQLPIRPFPWGVLLVLFLGVVWLGGQLVYTRFFTQLAVLGMVPAAVLTVFGVQWLRVLAFPFFILLFALPIWGVLVPTLVKWSAFFSELAIRASGIPIYRDGAYFILPSGSWSIADACSGVAFFSTSLLLGVLYARTIYQSARKRVLFVLAAAGIGLIGNWLRVYLTIMVAHISDNRYLRDDHYMFGWYLFACFLTALCWLGWRYRDPSASSELNQLQNEISSLGNGALRQSSSLTRIGMAAIAVFLLVGVWPLIRASMAEHVNPASTTIAAIIPADGWATVDNVSAEWIPEIRNSDAMKSQSFSKNGRQVTVFFGMYAKESWDAKLVSVTNRLAGSDGSKWSLADRSVSRAEFSGRALDTKTGIVLGRGQRILVWHWYWVDGHATATDLSAKALQLLARCRGIEPKSVWVAISTDATGSSDEANKVLREFVRDMAPSMANALSGPRG